jgi:hypothetical protein
MTMTDVFVSRYVDRPADEVVQALESGETRTAAPSLGRATRLHRWMVVLSVHGEVEGHVRVITVASGSHPVTELLFVGRTAAVDEAEDLVDVLVALVVESAPPVTGARTGRAARGRVRTLGRVVRGAPTRV